MSRFVTGAAAVVVAVMMLHGQRTATSQPSAFLQETISSRVSMSPGPGGEPGTQWWAQAASISSNDDEAEYRQERRACESLAGDARNHCVEYAKLRYGRS